MSADDRAPVRPISVRRLVERQVVIEEHAPLPDGSGAVVVERRVHGETYRSHLVLVRFRTGSPPVALTDGAVRDTSPEVSPDGRHVAFLRSFPDDPDASTRLMLVPTSGGAAVTAWAARHGISGLAWSPDGRRLAVVAPADPPRFLVGASAAPASRTPTARQIRRIDWRWDGVGHRDRRDHAWVLRARAGARPRQLTRGEFDVKSLAWSPDGRRLAFTADPRPDADIRPRPSIWTVDVQGPAGEAAVPCEVIALAGYAGSPAWSPDGRRLACVGVDVAEPFDSVQPGLFVAPADGAGPAVALASDLDLPIGAWLDTDLNGWMCAARTGPFWDGETGVVAMVSRAGRAVPWHFPVDPAGGAAGVAPGGGPGVAPGGGGGGAPRPLVDADVAAWSIGVANGIVSLVGTLDARPMELMTAEPGAGEAGRLRLRTWTSSGSGWRRGLPWPEMRRVLVPGPGGPIETWIASPRGAGTRPLPAVVDVHGGPLGAWSPAPSLETVLLCSRGFRVILPNIRGSAGYGAAWIEPQLGDWGGVDAADVLAAVDHVVGLGLADAGRLGLLGLSYGGFMVNWLVGAEPGRFGAAVSENGVTNQVSDWANSDSGPEYDRAARLGDVFSQEGVSRLWRQSPLRHVARVRTPLLMLQAEADLRCPAPDNEQLFIALRMLERDVEYVLYPESHHTFAITGRPDRRTDRHERMLAWFERHLLSGDATAR